MWEAKEEHVILEEPYNHASYMDYLKWQRMQLLKRDASEVNVMLLLRESLELL
jgi:hypothetical protein